MKKEKSVAKRKKTKSSQSGKTKKQTPSIIIPVFVTIIIILVALAIFLVYMFDRINLPGKPGETVTKKPGTGLDVNNMSRFECLPVYFYDSTAQYFVPVHMPVVDDAMFRDIRARKIVERLVAGPPSESLQSVMPSGTAINSVTVDKDLVIVDLSKEIASYGGGSTLERGIVQSLLLSLTELPNIKRLQILIDGERKEYLPEGTEIEQPIERNGGPNSDQSVPEGLPSGYMFFLDRTRNFIVPVRWVWEGNASDPAAKLSALYKEPQYPLSESLVSPAPEGIKIISCEIKNSTLNLVLEHEDFANVFKEYSAKDFLEATYLTLLDLQSFSKVNITIGTGDKALPIWSYADFSEFENMKIPPLCYNESRMSITQTN